MAASGGGTNTRELGSPGADAGGSPLARRGLGRGPVALRPRPALAWRGLRHVPLLDHAPPGDDGVGCNKHGRCVPSPYGTHLRAGRALSLPPAPAFSWPAGFRRVQGVAGQDEDRGQLAARPPLAHGVGSDAEPGGELVGGEEV